jgi:hypothetical protein
MSAPVSLTYINVGAGDQVLPVTALGRPSIKGCASPTSSFVGVAARIDRRQSDTGCQAASLPILGSRDAGRGHGLVAAMYGPEHHPLLVAALGQAGEPPLSSDGAGCRSRRLVCRSRGRRNANLGARFRLQRARTVPGRHLCAARIWPVARITISRNSANGCGDGPNPGDDTGGGPSSNRTAALVRRSRRPHASGAP